jgi:hypothetical protein
MEGTSASRWVNWRLGTQVAAFYTKKQRTIHAKKDATCNAQVKPH